MVGQPGCARLFEACLEYMTVAALDHTRTNGQAQCERARIVQRIQPIVQVAIAIAHRRLLVGRAFRLQMEFQRLDDLLHRTPPQSLLLRSAPGIWLAGSTTERGCSQILADMKKVA